MTYKGAEHSHSQEGCANDWQDPVVMLLCCPPVPEERQWNEKRSGYHRGQTVFWFGNAAILFSEILQKTVRNDTQHDQTRDGSDADA